MRTPLLIKSCGNLSTGRVRKKTWCCGIMRLMLHVHVMPSFGSRMISDTSTVVLFRMRNDGFG
jgi:hypothetical protein